MAWHLRLGGHCYSASRLIQRKLYRAALRSVDVRCEGEVCCFLIQGSLRNLINMVMGLLGGPSGLLMNGGEKHNRSALASTLENQSHVKRRAFGSCCSSCHLFLTEHNSCSFPWSTTAVHRASAARGLEVESAWGPHPWYRWDYFIMVPVQCLEVRCWVMYCVFACVFRFFISYFLRNSCMSLGGKEI